MTTITSPRGSPSQVTEAAPVPASPLDAEDLRARVDTALAALLGQELSALGFLGPDNGPVTDALTRFALEGGKRLRPAFVYWGYRGAGGPPDGPAAEAAARPCASASPASTAALAGGATRPPSARARPCSWATWPSPGPMWPWPRPACPTTAWPPPCGSSTGCARS